MDRRSIAVIAAAGLACLAVAVPVSGAFGADDGNGTSGTQQQQRQQPPEGYGQPPQGYGQPPQGGRPDGNCPKHDGNGQSQGSADSSAPAPTGDSVAL